MANNECRPSSALVLPTRMGATNNTIKLRQRVEREAGKNLLS